MVVGAWGAQRGSSCASGFVEALRGLDGAGVGIALFSSCGLRPRLSVAVGAATASLTPGKGVISGVHLLTAAAVVADVAPCEPEQLTLFEVGSLDMGKLRTIRAGLLRRPGAAATERAYRADWLVFSGWCKRAGRSALPASAESVELFLVSEQEGGAALGTLRRRISGIRAAHRGAGLPVPVMTGANKLLHEWARDGRGRARPKAALTVEQLGLLLAQCDTTAPRGLRDRALLLLGFASALRRGELAALDLADVRMERRGLELSIGRSKTDQAGEGRTVAVWRVARPDLDPVRAVQEWIRVRGRWAGPLFTRWRGPVALRERIAGEVVHDLVQRCAVAAGLDGERFGAHSLRAGFVTAAIRGGAPLPAIMGATGHKSIRTLSGYYRPVGAWGASNPLAGAL